MKIKLRQAFDLQMGKTPARNRPDYWNGDHKWISIADIGNAGKFLTKTKESITAAGIDGSGIKVVPQGTVIMSFKLSIGKTAITSEDMYTNEAIMAFIDNGKFAVDTNYLYHLCCGTNWTAGTNKAVMGLTLNKATLLEKEIPLPDINEQHEIATKLDKIDALIAERQQQLELIDQAVKSRFIELFGDPVRNSMGLPTEPMTTVCAIIDGDRGKNYPKQDEFSDTGYCLFLNAKNVTATGFSFENRMFITKEKDNALHNGKLERGDVVLTTRGTLGNLAFYDDSVPFENVRINSGMVILRMNKSVMTEVFFMEQFKLQLQSIKGKIASGSAQPQLPISTMSKIRILLAPMALQEQFAAFVEQTDKSKLAVQKGLQELEILKKSLMQQYFG
jgi:restriction modification system DNA specificity domain protein